MSDVLIERQEGRVRWLILNRPEKRNALNAALIVAITTALERAERDADVRAIVLTGAGDRAFCAGADLEKGAAFDDLVASPRLPYADMLRAARQLTKPLIARVNGACMAGGIGLLCMADLAVARHDAKFGLPEVRVGLFPAQVMSLLCDIVPDRIAREWALSGESFTADEALHAGLLNHVVPGEALDTKVNWLVDRLVDKSPQAIARGKYVMAAMADMSFEQRIAFAEGQIAIASTSADAREGLAAFEEKRPPAWSRR